MNRFAKDHRTVRSVLTAVYRTPPMDDRFVALLDALAAEDARLSRQKTHTTLDAA